MSDFCMHPSEQLFCGYLAIWLPPHTDTLLQPASKSFGMVSILPLPSKRGRGYISSIDKENLAFVAKVLFRNLSAKVMSEKDDLPMTCLDLSHNHTTTPTLHNLGWFSWAVLALTFFLTLHTFETFDKAFPSSNTLRLSGPVMPYFLHLASLRWLWLSSFSS